MSWNGTVRCSWCHKKGHNRRSCPELKKYAEENPDGWAAQQLKRSKQSAQNRRCRYCGEQGHNRRSCPTLKQHKHYANIANAEARVGILELVLIAAAAGIGEEILFRGALQPEVGLIWSSVIFGGLHTSSRETLAFGVWAMFMGYGLGFLAAGTNGLLAPTVAHGVYDAVAIGYLRWGKLGCQ